MVVTLLRSLLLGKLSQFPSSKLPGGITGAGRWAHPSLTKIPISIGIV